MGHREIDGWGLFYVDLELSLKSSNNSIGTQQEDGQEITLQLEGTEMAKMESSKGTGSICGVMSSSTMTGLCNV